MNQGLLRLLFMQRGRSTALPGELQLARRCEAPQLSLPFRTLLPGGVRLTGATLFWLVCAAVYVYLESLGGSAAALFYYVLLLHTHKLYLSLGHSAALQLALIVHAISWFAQVVVGHALIEKRRPALLESLVSSLLLAPFFVVLEVACASFQYLWHRFSCSDSAARFVCSRPRLQARASRKAACRNTPRAGQAPCTRQVRHRGH